MPAYIYDTGDHGLAIGYAANQDVADHLWLDATPASWADKFEPHGPTASDWMENGFQCACVNCEHMVSLGDTCEDCIDEWSEDHDAECDLLGWVMIDDNGDVFCNQRCHDAHHDYMDRIRAERTAKVVE